MKKGMMTLLAAIALVAIFIGVNGCGDDDVTFSDVNDLFGAWDQSSVTVNGTASNLGDVLDWEDDAVRGRMIFYNSYAYAAYEYNASDSAVYTESGDFVTDDEWLILTVATENDSTVAPHQSYNGKWSTDGSVLTLTQTSGDDTMVLTLTRPQ